MEEEEVLRSFELLLIGGGNHGRTTWALLLHQMIELGNPQEEELRCC